MLKISHKAAIDAAKTIHEYCEQQYGCQNCVFRKHAPDHWKCEICAFDLRNVTGNYEAKRKNHGYIG